MEACAMTPTTMINRCRKAYEALDLFEANMKELPETLWPWVYESIKAVKELYDIAKFETIKSMTAEQIDHIIEIQRQIKDAWKTCASKDLRDEYGP
jgi:hypothetical protein